MPIRTDIVLERRGPTSLKPRDGTHTTGGRTRVPAESTVVFRAPAGVVGTDITFVGRSPFATASVAYETELTVTAPFNASNPASNVYRYRCKGKAGGVDLTSEDGGGEMEVGHN